MRTYGRDINGAWREVAIDATGHDSYIQLTTLAQVLKLSPNEDPFFAQYGIPAQQSIITQVAPDFFVARTQSQFAQYFASLSIRKRAGITPLYDITPIFKNGTLKQDFIAT